MTDERDRLIARHDRVRFAATDMHVVSTVARHLAATYWDEPPGKPDRVRFAVRYALEAIAKPSATIERVTIAPAD
jgi:hypothetical protein